MTQYSPHFTREELACPGSGELKLARGFIDKLEEIRITYARPMVVTSGCRSSKRNEWLRRRGYAASPNSLHLIENKKYGTDCCAVDIARPNGVDLHALIRIAAGSMWSVGIADTFIHLDRRGDYTSLRPVVYTY